MKQLGHAAQIGLHWKVAIQSGGVYWTTEMRMRNSASHALRAGSLRFKTQKEAVTYLYQHGISRVMLPAGNRSVASLIGRKDRRCRLEPPDLADVRKLGEKAKSATKAYHDAVRLSVSELRPAHSVTQIAAAIGISRETVYKIMQRSS